MRNIFVSISKTVMSKSFHKEMKCGSDFPPSEAHSGGWGGFGEDGGKSLPLKITFLLISNHGFGNAYNIFVFHSKKDC